MPRYINTVRASVWFNVVDSITSLELCGNLWLPQLKTVKAGHYDSVDNTTHNIKIPYSMAHTVYYEINPLHIEMTQVTR